MRCARCDRPVVPQATGVTDRGQVVFGWCIDCLNETGCGEIAVSDHGVRGPSTLLELSEPSPSNRSLHVRKTPASDSIEARFHVLGAVALALTLWGLAVGAFGFGLLFRKPMVPAPASPLGNGTPPLLIGGGSATVLTGIGLWVWTIRQKGYLSTNTVRRVRRRALFLGLSLIAVAGFLRRR